jgi:hypothetical protein
MKAYGGVDVFIHIFVTSALAVEEWSASSPRYPLNKRLGGPQSRSGRFAEEKILDPTGIRTPSRYTDYAIQAPRVFITMRNSLAINLKLI